MDASTRTDLSGRLDAVIEEARGRVKAFQTEAESTRQGFRERYQQFLPIAERIVGIAREKLERLTARLTFDVSFNSHAHLDMPLESYDEAAVAKWLDDQIVEFTNAYLELHSTKQYQERVLVSDTVAGIAFPKHYAASTLDHGGTTYYSVRDETRRVFEKQHGLTP